MACFQRIAALALALGATSAAAASPPLSCSSLGIPVVVGKDVYRTKYTIVTVAPGPHTPARAVMDAGTTVSALVVGTLQDGTLFWNSSSPPAGTPAHPGWFTFQYTMPVSGLITGFDVGVHGMYEGETRQLCIPPDEGYGPRSRPGIPANSTLIFTITAEKIAAPTSARPSAPAPAPPASASARRSARRVAAVAVPFAAFAFAAGEEGEEEGVAAPTPTPAPAKYDACADKSDGDMCTVCDPANPACQGSGIVMTCQGGKCQPAGSK